MVLSTYYGLSFSFLAGTSVAGIPLRPLLERNSFRFTQKQDNRINSVPLSPPLRDSREAV